MKITYQQDPEHPSHPFMHGSTPFAKEFNKKYKEAMGAAMVNGIEIDVTKTGITEVIMEVLVDEYNKKKTRKKVTKKAS